MADFWSFFVLNYWPVPKWFPWSADTSPRRSRHISIWTKDFFQGMVPIMLNYIVIININGHLSYINHGHLPIMVIHLSYTMVILIIYKSPGLGSQVVRSPALGPWGLRLLRRLNPCRWWVQRWSATQGREPPSIARRGGKLSKIHGKTGWNNYADDEDYLNWEKHNIYIYISMFYGRNGFTLL